MNDSVGSIIKTLRWQFYDWCGVLSFDELCGNDALVNIIERLERMLIVMEG